MNNQLAAAEASLSHESLNFHLFSGLWPLEETVKNLIELEYLKH